MARVAPAPPTRRRPLPTVVVVTVLVVAAAVLVYVATRPLGGGNARPSFVAFGSAGPGVRIGQAAPGMAPAGGARLALVGPNGTPMSLGDLADHPVWLIFWKTACEPCEAEAADVAAAYAAHRADGLALIGIDVWDSPAAVRDYVSQHPLQIPIAVAEGSAAIDAYGVWGAPTHYFIDRTGIIRDRYFGPMPRDLIDESLRRII